VKVCALRPAELQADQVSADHARWAEKQTVLSSNVIVWETDQYGKQITPACYFRVIIEFLHAALSFLLIMPTYSGEDLTNALAAYRNSEFTSIRKCAYAFRHDQNVTVSDVCLRHTDQPSR
jgi:hypothetical protein